jgi:hypothetical protein
MFKRGKGDETANPAPGRPTPTRDLDLACLKRHQDHLSSLTAFEKSGGVKSTATLTSLTLVYECQGDPDLPAEFAEIMHPTQEWTVEALVDAGGGDQFPASFTFWSAEGDPLPAIGQVVKVVYDASDRTKIMGDLAVAAAGHHGVRWKVPATCPSCGAPVDQSTQSQAEHPTCNMCRTPLPCEPL